VTTYDTTTAGPAGLADIKRGHRRTWASGNYAAVAERLIADVPRRLLERTPIEPGTEVLDVAAGTGNAAIEAARLGARVTALDLTPELLEIGRRRAAATGVEIDWVEGDAEDLPFEDGRFDAVISTFGIQFAPRHEVAAQEAVRVARPGGAIALANWTPQGHIGRVLRAVGSKLPKPPGYASPPPLWGDEEHVRALLERAGAEPRFERATTRFDGFGSAAAWVDFMADEYGPLVTARAKLEPGGAWEGLRDELVELTVAADSGEPDALRVDAEYLMVLATAR
jgi:SAM-dependent methyltransferase